MANKLPGKPENQQEQISLLWDIIANHILSRLKWQDRKINFILIFTGLILALMAIGATFLGSILSRMMY